jgi:hypothetical protein
MSSGIVANYVVLPVPSEKSRGTDAAASEANGVARC